MDEKLTLNSANHQLIEENTFIDDGIVFGQYHGLHLTSHYQPIFSLPHNRAVGAEALVRTQNINKQPVSPVELFNRASDEDETVFLDRLCRDVHLRNFSDFGDDNLWLFLNVNPTAIINRDKHGSFFQSLIEHYQFPAHRIVIEILESRITNEETIFDALNYYRDMGCLIAIDDFGAGHSNFDRIWRLKPEIVKLDRSLIQETQTNPQARRILPQLVNLIHESGSLSLIEGIETEDEALVAIESETDFVQGYYFSRPASPADFNLQPSVSITDLFHRHYHHSNKLQNQRKTQIEQIRTHFQSALWNLIKNETLENAGKLLLHQESVQRIYLLNEEGTQVSKNLSGTDSEMDYDQRFEPLQQVEQADWSRRSYFRQCMEDPAKVKISRPYLSIIDSSTCVTMSASFTNNDGLFVLCCDLQWEMLSQ